MSYKNVARKMLMRATVLHTYRSPPWGTDFCFHLEKALPRFRLSVIFNVGANVGQSVAEYLTKFPSARIHAFETVAATAEMLRQSSAGNPQVQIERIARATATVRR